MKLAESYRGQCDTTDQSRQDNECRVESLYALEHKERMDVKFFGPSRSHLNWPYVGPGNIDVEMM